MTNINDLQSAQMDWARKNFGPCVTRWPLLGIFEEIGELSHAQLKQEQGIRGTFEQQEAAKKDAIADATIFLFEYCSCMGWKIVDMLVEEETTLEELQAHTEESAPVWDCIVKILPLILNPLRSGDNVLAQEDAVQILLNLAIYCRDQGWSLQEIVETTWLRVSQRDWTKNKKDGGDTVDADDKKLDDYLVFLASDKGKGALERSITREIEKWRADQNYIPILPGPTPISHKVLEVGGSPGPQKDSGDAVGTRASNRASFGGEIFILSSDDPHAPSALYGYSESLRYGYPEGGIEPDEKKGEAMWEKADRWSHAQPEVRSVALRITPRAGLRTEGARSGRFDASKPNPSAAPGADATWRQTNAPQEPPQDMPVEDPKDRMDFVEDTQFTCPRCGAHAYGSTFGQGNEIAVRMCHGEEAPGLGANCCFTWSAKDDAKYFKGTGTFHARTGILQTAIATQYAGTPYPGVCLLCMPGGNMNCGHTMRDIKEALQPHLKPEHGGPLSAGVTGASVTLPTNTFLTPDGQPPKDWPKILKAE